MMLKNVPKLRLMLLPVALMLLQSCAAPLPPQLPAVVACPTIPPLPSSARLVPRSETYLQRVQRNIEQWDLMLKKTALADSKPTPITTR